MLAHEFENTPGHRKTGIGDNPMEAVDLLTCKWCNRTPSKARGEGCAIRVLSIVGNILLSDYNPDGNVWFAGRSCITCHRPIMHHWLKRDSKDYWCDESFDVSSEGLVPVPVDPKDVAVIRDMAEKYK